MLKDSQVDLCGRTDFTRTAPLLARDEAFSFACAGCGGCCRGLYSVPRVWLFAN